MITRIISGLVIVSLLTHVGFKMEDMLTRLEGIECAARDTAKETEKCGESLQEIKSKVDLIYIWMD